MNDVPESMLAFDIGNAYAKAILIDQIADAYRFVARGLAPQVVTVNPRAKLTDVLHEALRDVERLSGRRIAGVDGMPVVPEELGTGVDAVAGTVSMQGLIEVAIAAIRDDQLVRWAEGALRAVPSRVVASITGRDIAARSDALEEYAQILRDSLPQVLLLIGGSEKKPDRTVVALAEALAVAVSLIRPNERPTLVYTGPSGLCSAIMAAIGDVMPVRMVESLSPDGRTSNQGPLRAELDNLYLTFLGTKTSGMEQTWRWCGGRISTISRAMLQAYSRPGVDVLAVDLGACCTVMVMSAGGEALVQPDCGIGQGARPLLEKLGANSVLRWLLAEITEEEVLNWALNKNGRPWVKCVSQEECEIELGFAREALGTARQFAASSWPETANQQLALPPRADLVVGGGAILGGTKSLPGAVLALLDGLQPVGVSRLALDWGGLSAGLGALAELNPDAARSVLERDSIRVVGTLIAPIGQSRFGRQALRVEINTNAGDTTDMEVNAGDIVCIPLPPGTKGRATVQPTKPFDIGTGKPGEGLEVEVEGGPLGVIVDARGRPLPDINRIPERLTRLREWRAALGG